VQSHLSDHSDEPGVHHQIATKRKRRLRFVLNQPPPTSVAAAVGPPLILYLPSMKWLS
jgi:hypothetical protein